MAIGMLEDKASNIGARPLIIPKFRNSLPLVDSLTTPERKKTAINAPAPTHIINMLKSFPSVAPNLSTESTGRTDSKDMVKPQ